MALADILKRIDRDAEAEASALVLAAEAEAERMRTESQARGEAYRSRETDRVERESAEDARTRLASARLRGRDRVLGEKRAMIDRAFRKAEESILALPDDRYLALIVKGIAASVRGGEEISVGAQDAGRLGDSLQDALAAAHVDARVVGPTSEVERGVLVSGHRMRVEVSPSALIASRRSELEELIMDVLFGGEEDL